MRVTRHRRQILLFLTAILLPASVLIGLGSLTIVQERELAIKRVADRRRDALEQAGRELFARLEAIKLREINRLIRLAGTEQAKGPENPAAILVAKIEGDRLILPWEPAPQPDLRASTEYNRNRQEGEAAEFIKKDSRAAAASYRQAVAAARIPTERSEGRLLLARALAKTGSSEESFRNYRALLTEDSDGRDEQGVGYRFYAAERLLQTKREDHSVMSFLSRQVSGEVRLSLPELYMIRSLLSTLPEPEARNLQASIAGRIRQMEEVVELAKDFQRVRAQIESAAGPVWIPYGEEPWLVTIAPPATPLPGVVVVVSSAKAAPPGVTLLGRRAQGDVLGESFPGLHVKWPENRFLEEGRQRSPIGLYGAGLVLVLGITSFGGYLLLRDVNRDIRMTEVRSQFVASVSHELKTPLTAIRMFAETLALGRSRDARTQSEYLETIVNESERLARLVDNVLDFSKLEQGKKIYRLRPTNLADVADSAVRAMQYPLAQQGFQLHVSVAEDLPSLRADPDAIQQAILNLLTNAMKYSGEAREIDLRLCARNGDALIQVTDRGLGIPPDEQKRVFEKFYRAPSHESRLIAGTGLGLTLVAHIAEAHGGRVELQSSPGAGSTFSILIPIQGEA
jgi:signal transduction histidine kinase